MHFDLQNIEEIKKYFHKEVKRLTNHENVYPDYIFDKKLLNNNIEYDILEQNENSCSDDEILEELGNLVKDESSEDSLYDDESILTEEINDDMEKIEKNKKESSSNEEKILKQNTLKLNFINKISIFRLFIFKIILAIFN